LPDVRREVPATLSLTVRFLRCDSVSSIGVG